MLLPDLADLAVLLELLESQHIDLGVDHRRYTFLGHSGTALAGPFVVRWELAFDVGRAFDAGDVDAEIPVLEPAETTFVEAMAGAGYTGLSNTRIDLELRRGVFPNRPDDLVFPADMMVYATRVEYTAFREKLRLDAVFTGFGDFIQYGWLARGGASYELADGWRASLGAITYQPSEERGPLLGLDRHNRLFAQLRMDF
jgi:hypothetical protein